MELPAALTVVGLTVVVFGVVGFGFGVVASKSKIRKILFFLILDVYCKPLAKMNFLIR